MRIIAKPTIHCLMLLAMLLSFSEPLQAWEPNAKALETVIDSGEFADYFANLSA